MNEFLDIADYLNNLNVWTFLAGLGIFLFGIMLMEESIKNLSGKAFKQFIRRYTATKLKAILSGAFVTAILQSSSAVTLMVLAFAGAGIIELANAVGIIVGSNLGTTFTSWIVATIGFKLDISALSFPFIGMGGLGLIFFGKSTRATNISKLAVGFGFLFLGLDFMRSAVESLSEKIPVEQFAAYGSWVFIIIGFVITAIVQSSSAAMAIVLSALYSGIISIDAGCAFVIGTNLGTTVTVVIGSIGGVSIKKRIAFSHFTFNFGTSLIAFMLLPLLTRLVFDVFNFRNDPVMGLALFHSIFNLLGVIIFYPFLGIFANMLKKFFHAKKSPTTLYIHTVLPEMTESAIATVRQETQYMLWLSAIYSARMTGVHRDLPTPYPEAHLVVENAMKSGKTDELYRQIRQLQPEIISFVAKVQSNEMAEASSFSLNNILYAVKLASAVAKIIREMENDWTALEESDATIIVNELKTMKIKIRAYLLQITELPKLNAEEKAKAISDMRKSFDKEDTQSVNKVMGLMQKSEVSKELLSSLLSVYKGAYLALSQLLLGYENILTSAQTEQTIEAIEN